MLTQDDGSVQWIEAKLERLMQHYIQYRINKEECFKELLKDIDDTYHEVRNRYLLINMYPPYDTFDQAVSYYAIQWLAKERSELHRLQNAVMDIVYQFNLD